MRYTAMISWGKKQDEAFIDNQYNRSHIWKFDGGIELTASSSPQVVPIPYSNEMAVDPEEAFIASLSSCHMLWFLSIACQQKYIVENYEDHAEGILGKNSEGRLAMVKVTLKPKVKFNNKTIPTPIQIQEIHHQAHEKCFIANSVKTEINIMPME